MDGSFGYTAEQGFEAVLGGKNIDRMNRREGAMTPGQMRQYIESAPSERDVSYSDETRRFAKAILKIADQDNLLFLKNSREKNYDFTKGLEKENFDLTGFMYGWATNAVRYVLFAEPVQNPAIVTMGY
jgi:hypothetical protein